MQPSSSTDRPVRDDVSLVQASLAGDRTAFSEIVTRYQTLVCSLAYSATGSLERSEDLAQETFVTAWQRLATLREPSKLRPWLCGIARHLTSNAQRHAGREPGHLGQPLDTAPEMAAAEPSPSEQAVSREEAAMLWQALGRIPETYREPLVLFYREGHSVDTVASELDLSPDAVKQRLSRGRGMLHEQVLAMVEGSLERSRPDRRFTMGVMAALPLMGAGTGTATTMGAGGSKATAWLKPLGVLLTAQVLWFVSSVALVAALGGFAGWQMADPAQSAAERRWAGWFWRLLTGSLLVFLLPVLLLESFGPQPLAGSFAAGLGCWLGLLYVVPVVPLACWAVANHRRCRQEKRAAGPAFPEGSILRWATAATLGVTALLAGGLIESHWYEKTPPDRLREIILTQPDARIRIDQLASGARWAAITSAPDRGKVARHSGPLDEATYAELQLSGRHYETRVQGRDYDTLGWPARRMGAMCIAAAAAGVLFLFRHWRLGRSNPGPAVSG